VSNWGACIRLSTWLLIKKKIIYSQLMTASILFIAIATTLVTLVFVAAWILATRSTTDREKSSPFECGFDPKNTARIPFSLRFFLLALIFIVFDIEIVLLIPLPILARSLPTTSVIITRIIFLTILLIGLFHEWNEGSLDWSC